MQVKFYVRGIIESDYFSVAPGALIIKPAFEFNAANLESGLLILTTQSFFLFENQKEKGARQRSQDCIGFTAKRMNTITQPSKKREFNFALPNAKIIRVSKRNRCPICDKPDFCGVSADGQLAFCMRISQGSIKEARNGAYVHVLGVNFTPISPQAIQKQQDIYLAPKASAERLNAAYGAILNALTLKSEHRADLIRRGLNDEAITRAGYKSTPTTWHERQAVIKAVSDCDLKGVPGFFGNRQMVTAFSGFFCPFRDEDGNIIGLQIRQDKGTSKYIWFSSSKFDGGASIGKPLHFAGNLTARELFITEGSLKADVINHLSGVAVVAVAGVHSVPADIGQRLKVFPNLEKIQIAYDADLINNSAVLDAIKKLTRLLKDAGQSPRVAFWDVRDGKGLDDFLLKSKGGK